MYVSVCNGSNEDSFYWTGALCDESFGEQWADIYGTNLTSVPWLGVFGYVLIVVKILQCSIV